MSEADAVLADYVTNPDACHVCGDTRITPANRFNIEGRMATQRVHCHGCESEWTDTYLLSARHNVEVGVGASSAWQLGGNMVIVYRGHSIEAMWFQPHNGHDPLRTEGIFPVRMATVLEDISQYLSSGAKTDEDGGVMPNGEYYPIGWEG